MNEKCPLCGGEQWLRYANGEDRPCDLCGPELEDENVVDEVWDEDFE